MARRTVHPEYLGLKITTQMYADIKELAELAGISDATLVRAAITEYLPKIHEQTVYNNKLRKQFQVEYVVESKPNYTPH